MGTAIIIILVVINLISILYWLAYFIGWIGMQTETLTEDIIARQRSKRRAKYKINPKGYTRAELRAGYGQDN